jgi:diacylglycerol kinase
MGKRQQKFSLSGRIKSFGHAINGICLFFKTEHNARIHLVATIFVVFFGFWLSISRVEWLMVLFAIGFVFSAEVFNTAIEKMADEISTDYKEPIKNIKDLSAAAVLVAAITAALIGLIVFIPALIDKIAR